MKGLPAEGARGTRSHGNQMVDIRCSVSITGWYAEQHLTQVVCVTKGEINKRRKGMGSGASVLAECKHYCANGRGKQHEFLWGNDVVCFHNKFHVPCV